jgi:PEP-CTERM motif
MPQEEFSVRFLKLSFAAIIVQFLLTVAPALADTYQIFTLDSDEARFVYGMNPSGDVVLTVDDVSGQCVTVVNCYETFIGGVLASRTNTPPPGFLNDDGTACSPTAPPGLTVLHAVCNNGREVFSARAPGQLFPDLYTGPNIADLFPGEGAGDFLYLNSEGDILWNDPRTEFWFEAFDLTSQVPEPASIFLLGTGGLAALEAIRRRALLQQL